MSKWSGRNALYYGDNLAVLRESIPDESVDLIYLDPPFNSNASYNVLFKSPDGDQSAAQIEAFDDTWHWTDVAESAYQEVLTSGNSDASEMLRAMRSFLGENDMMAYLAMMAVRLIELHRVLKPTGSLYLHCDPTASHYLKILLDAVFGPRNFRNEIIWKRTFAHGSSKRWGPVHDTLLFYSKSAKFNWTGYKIGHDTGYIEKHFNNIDPETGKRFSPITLTGSGVRTGESGQPWRGIDPTDSGRHWALPTKILESIGVTSGGVHERLDKLDEAGYIYWPKKEDGKPRLKHFADALTGVAIGDVVIDIPPLSAHSQERLGYPTQKPVTLLERIINASSNPGDVVLDPFCGCGTTVHAAQKLGRRWIGIDVTHLAISLIKRRLFDAFGDQAEFETLGVPKDLDGAKALAEADKYEFEKWAVSLIPNAQPWKGGKKGADRGIDGVLYVGQKSDRCFISVKGGRNIGVAMLRDLVGVLDREKAPMGLFVTLYEPTKPMVAEAAAAGHWVIEGFEPVPKLQIVTIEQLLTSVSPPFRVPLARHDTFKKAQRESRTDQGKLDL